MNQQQFAMSAEDEIQEAAEGGGLADWGGAGSSRQMWNIEPHVCRVCRGRVLSRTDDEGTVHYRCASCGFKGRGNVESMCCCGVTWGTHGHILRCAENDMRRSDAPQEYIAIGELKPQRPDGGEARRNPVSVPEA